jgi:hypothetical protein
MIIDKSQKITPQKVDYIAVLQYVAAICLAGGLLLAWLSNRNVPAGGCSEDEIGKCFGALYVGVFIVFPLYLLQLILSLAVVLRNGRLKNSHFFIACLLLIGDLILAALTLH